MRILFVSAIDFPEPLDRGAHYHVHYWLKALSVENHIDFLLVESYSTRRETPPSLPNANVINLSEPPKMDIASRLGRMAHALIVGIPISAQIAMPKAALDFVRKAVSEKRYDLAILWAGSASGYAELLQGPIPTILSKLSIDAVDARDQRKRAGIWHPRWTLEEWVTRRYERRVCRATTAICAVNDEDARELVRRYQLSNIVRAIPVGVELSKFPRRDKDPLSKVVSFTANLKWGTNVDAVKWLVQQIVPGVLKVHPDARFRVIGPGGDALEKKYANEKVEFLGYVPSVREALADVAVGVVPVLSGTGMRLKLMELLCMGIPAVTTTLGAAGVPCASGEQLLIADGTEAFANAVNLLLSDSALREKLSRNGPEIARRFSWASTEDRVRLLARDTVAAGKKNAGD